MILYIASEIYNEVIRSTIEQCGQLILQQEISNEIYLLKYIKQHLASMEGVEQFIIDLSALKDTDEEIVQAIENYRMMYVDARIIILATNRHPGDELLKNLFQLGLYNLVLTEDYLVLKEELRECITTGKTFRDAIGFKDAESAAEKVIVKQEIKQVINKIMIGIAGSQKRMGCTHTAISLASALRSKGYMVAVAEYNESEDFRYIMDSFCETLIDNDYFSIGGIDFYPKRNETSLAAVLGQSYNFVIVDFGAYPYCDQVTYNKSNVRLMVCGSKPYELQKMQAIFSLCPEEMLLQTNFLFNLTYPEHEHDIRESMKTADKKAIPVEFLEYQPFPYNVTNITGMDRFLKEYLPVKMEEKKGFFKRRKGS